MTVQKPTKELHSKFSDAITDRQYFIDTVQGKTTCFLNDNMQADFVDCCGHFDYREDKGKSRKRGRQYTVQMDQPTQEAYALWREHIEIYSLNGLDVEIEVIFKDYPTCRDARNYAVATVTKRHRGKQARGYDENSTYAVRKGWRKPAHNIDIYMPENHDYRSKVTGERWALRIELREFGKDALERAHVEYIQDLDNFDALAFMRKNIECKELDADRAKLGACVRKTLERVHRLHRKNTELALPSDARLGDLLLRGSQLQDEPEVATDDVRSTLRKWTDRHHASVKREWAHERKRMSETARREFDKKLRRECYYDITSLLTSVSTDWMFPH